MIHHDAFNYLVHDLPPSALQLEVTESLLLKNSENSAKTLTALRDHGIRVAIDDFGTGYSSMSYLSFFPIDIVKIDGSFVHDLESSEENAAIIRAIVALAHSLNLNCVAEGIETDEQRKFLMQIDCDEGQGFYFSQALNSNQFDSWVDGSAVCHETIH